MFTCTVFQLLPGGPCEDYCYRYKTLGAACPAAPMYEDAILATERNAAAVAPVLSWLRHADAKTGSTPLQRLYETGWSGWHPDNGIGFAISTDPDP